MSSVITIAANAVIAKIMNADDAIKDLATKSLSYLVEGHEHMHAFASGGWNGRSSFFARRTCSFPAGFLHLMHGELARAGYRVNLVKRPSPAPSGPESPIVDEFGNDDPRYDFQLRALRQVEKHSRGIIQVATGGGKSKIAKLIAARYRLMTMFITTRGVLMYQMKEDFENTCKFNVGIVGDGTWAPTKGINVGMVQTFVAQLKEPELDAEIRDAVAIAARKEFPITREQAVYCGTKTFHEKLRVRARLLKLLELVQVVIGEEAHEAGGNSYYEILRHCKNAQIRVALTATPFMRDSAEDNMRLMAAFGPVLIKVSEKTLIDRGVLAKPYFLYANPKPHPKLYRTSPWERAYKLEISGEFGECDRNETVIAYAKKASLYRLPVLVLVLRKAHGAYLRKRFKEAGITATFIQGENKQIERKAALKALGSHKLDTLIGTNILDVGVDVPAVGLLILAGGGKAEVALRQRIGRAMRAKKKGPNVAFILDYADEKNTHLRDHARTRRAIVEDTPGFAEGILPSGQDFPWGLFEQKFAA